MLLLPVELNWTFAKLFFFFRLKWEVGFFPMPPLTSRKWNWCIKNQDFFIVQNLNLEFQLRLVQLHFFLTFKYFETIRLPRFYWKRSINNELPLMKMFSVDWRIVYTWKYSFQISCMNEMRDLATLKQNCVCKLWIGIYFLWFTCKNII